MTGSPDKNAPPLSPETVCKVCGYPAHGLHFGVMACRACAAFFRRFIVLNLEYKCLNNAARCSLDKIRRSSCRHCRFQKCVQMGMTSDRVQWHRDSNLNNIGAENLSKKGMMQGSTRTSCSSEPSTSYSETPSSSDSVLPDAHFQSIEKEVTLILRSDFYQESQNRGPLYQFTKGLRLLRAQQKTSDVELESIFTLDALKLHWKNQAKTIANLMMYSEGFKSLEHTERISLFRHCWKSVYRLEKILVSVEVFGEDSVTEKIMIISSDQAICTDEISIDDRGIESKRIAKSLRSFQFYADRLFKDIAKPLTLLKLSIEEQAFLILIFLMNFDDDISPGQDKIYTRISDEIHEYYQTQRIVNYTPRILKMTRIAQAMMRIHYDDARGKFAVS